MMTLPAGSGWVWKGRGARLKKANKRKAEADAAIAAMRQKLVVQLRTLMEGMTQTEAAGIVGGGQSKVSALLKTEPDENGISTEQLIRWVLMFEQPVKLRLKPPPEKSQDKVAAPKAKRPKARSLSKLDPEVIISLIREVRRSRRG